MDIDTQERTLHRNDVHSRLNATRHERVLRPASVDDVVACIDAARRRGQRLAVTGASHAMGGQQFVRDGWLVDSAGLSGITAFDRERGLVRAGAGTRWPQLQAFLETQRGVRERSWAIRQKQTGADDFSLGGALAANIHGRGLERAPFVDDIECFTLVDAQGVVRHVDRRHHADLFGLAVGGYGLFGIVTDLTLRLEPRRLLRRRVALLRRAELSRAFAQARGDGATFGDFQFAVDPHSADFLDLGVFACYVPCDDATPAHVPRELAPHDWRELLHLAHIDKSEAFRRYSAFYVASDGQTYGSDDHQFGVYLDGYHQAVDACLGHTGSELITELYVPPASLDAFLGEVADDCRRHAMDVIYGTVRLIRAEHETQLAWATEDWACIVLNLHVRHDAPGQRKARDDMRRLIDRALGFGGSFYLTYHRHARADQLRTAYSGIDAVFSEKAKRDPDNLFCSDWYRGLCATLVIG